MKWDRPNPNWDWKNNPTSPGPVEPAPGTPADGDDPMPLARATASGGAQTALTGRGTQHGETAVSNIPYSLRTPWPETVQVKMRYRSLMGLQTYTATNVAQYQFRLNSIYDVYRNTPDAGSTEATATADTADATVQTPTWRPYWTNFYNYWTVVKSRYNARIWIKPNAYSTEKNNRDIQAMVYVYHHGLQAPPALSGTDAVEHKHRVDHDGMYYFPVNYTPETMGKSFAVDARTFSGDYTPGSIKHEVVEDELHQTWHKVTEVPPTPEILNIIIQKSPISEFGGSVDTRLEIEIEYDVQLKDLKQQFQYPTQGTDLAAVPDYAKQGN